MKLDLGISPCPNDTFIFYHLSKQGVAGNPVRLVFADVEELNRRAIEEARHAITKLSYAAMARLGGRYRLLQTGGALGRGCGPILISYDPMSADEARGRMRRVLIPGKYTTANLLMHLYLNDHGVDVSRIEFIPVRYDEIIPALNSGDADFGVIIHEERFTYKDHGLSAVQDLGAWWEAATGLPIPLGCIAVRTDVPEHLIPAIENGIRSSLQQARREPASTWNFIKEHSQSLEDDVIRAHINLYVNELSLDVDAEGRQAIDELFRRAEAAGI